MATDLDVLDSDDQDDNSAENALEMSLVNDLRELPRVAGAVDGFCNRHELGTHLSYAIDMALDEVLSYTIANAYDDDKTHPVEVAVYLDPRELVLLVVTDGVDLDVRQSEQDNAEAILDEQHLGELGLFLVQQVMDTVEYRREQGCNVVVMTKSRFSEVDPSTESD